MKFHQYKFSRQIWVILIGILLLRVGTTISLPFLSIFLHFKVGISLPTTGFIVGVSYLSYVAGGVFGGIFAYLVYAQQLTTLGQILMQRFNNSNLFAMLLTLNAVTVICLQIPLTNYFLKKHKPLSVMKIGCIFLSIGLLGMAFAEVKYPLYIVSQIIFTLGEVLIFPIGGIFIDKIAPKEMRGAYFGATGFQYFGMAIGPALGGFFLQSTNGKVTLSIFAVLSLITVFFYHKGNQSSSEYV